MEEDEEGVGGVGEGEGEGVECLSKTETDVR